MSDFFDSIPEGAKVFPDSVPILIEELIVDFVIDDAFVELLNVFDELWKWIFHVANLLVVILDLGRSDIHPLHGVIDLIGAKRFKHERRMQEISHFAPEAEYQLVAKVFERLSEYLLGTLLGDGGGLAFNDLYEGSLPNFSLARELLELLVELGDHVML